jgi:hypothetical protein
MYVLYFSSFNDLMYFYCYLGCMAIMFSAERSVSLGGDSIC